MVLLPHKIYKMLYNMSGIYEIQENMHDFVVLIVKIELEVKTFRSLFTLYFMTHIRCTNYFT